MINLLEFWDALKMPIMALGKAVIIITISEAQFYAQVEPVKLRGKLANCCFRFRFAHLASLRPRCLFDKITVYFAGSPAIFSEGALGAE